MRTRAGVCLTGPEVPEPPPCPVPSAPALNVHRLCIRPHGQRPRSSPAPQPGAQLLSGFRIQTGVTHLAFLTPPHISLFRGEKMFPVSLCLKRTLTSIEHPVCFHIISASQQTTCNRFLSPTRFSQVQEVESHDVIKGERRPEEVCSFHLNENRCFLVPKIIYAHCNRLK